MASLPNTATKAELVEAHRNKMQWKKEQRQFARSKFTPVASKHSLAPRSQRRMRWFTAPSGPIRANLSRNHPDFGLPPAEHARRKAGR